MHNYSFHPLADLFPLLEGAEFDELVADIKKNGLHEPIKLLGGKIIDGRNRYRACMAAGFKPDFTHLPAVDPIKYVISANIHRRHLTAEQKRDLIEKLLKATPEKSNRQVAKAVGVSHPHVAKVRQELEKAGDVETVTTSVDTKGRKQPAKKIHAKPQKPAPPREDIGQSSAGETARKLARFEELEHENAWLKRENLALRSEIDELRAVLDAAAGDTSPAEAKTRALELAKSIHDDLARLAPAPDGDGLDIPEWLQRTAP
jgi:ParB-like chromosome segregation protein Spo0J